ncbi:MAG: bile acid:sodium symporter [Tenacibaculum sp.]
MNISLSTVLNIMLFSIMLGMGSSLTFKHFRQVLKTPKPFVIGMLSQFGFLPFCGYLISLLLNLSPVMSMGLILIACTPGGSTSNLYTYYAKGDLALSISMTMASSLMATVMMPFLIAIYTKLIGIDGIIVVPYKKIFLLLLMLLIPVLTGMLIKKINSKLAELVEKISSYIGIIAIVVIFVIPLIKNKDMFNVNINVFIAPALIAGLGMFFGYAISRLVKLSLAQSKTVSLETGIQNAVLTIGIIVLSFDGELQKSLLVIPILYTFFIPLFSVLVSFVIFKKLKAR